MPCSPCSTPGIRPDLKPCCLQRQNLNRCLAPASARHSITTKNSLYTDNFCRSHVQRILEHPDYHAPLSTMADSKNRVAIVGASGYTGSDLIRLALRHPNISIDALTGATHAGKSIDQVFPHLSGCNLPSLVTNDDVNWDTIDTVFCGLPHATSQKVIKELPDHLKVIDMSADFRLRDTNTYKATYGNTHAAPELQDIAVYGLSEHYREQISRTRLVACPGCYPTATLLLLLPLVQQQLIDPTDLIIDAKSGVTGAGRALKQTTLFSEAGEGMGPYAVAQHRHAPEIEQELSRAAQQEITVNFTPHLIPMSRGELVTCYARLTKDNNSKQCKQALADFYKNDSFVALSPEGVYPQTQFVRGSNRVMLNAYDDRIANRVILIAALDNLVKGSSGQALQNFNIMNGYAETTGLEQIALFP